jgi:hypothetical protein
MKTSNNKLIKPLSQSCWAGISVLGLSLLAAANLANAEVIYNIDFEDMATGTLSDSTHPNWEGMLAGNQAGQDPSDWKIVDGGGLTWVASDGGVIEGGDKHFEMRSVSNITGRAFYDFDEPLPTDIGEPTSIYFRWVASFDEFENISQLGGDWTVWPLIRLNAAWQFRSILKWNDYTSAGGTELRFHIELHDDKDAAEGERTVATLEDKLGAPQNQTPYLVVMRYDFDAAGVLQGKAAWVNPNFADKDQPDLVSNHEQPGYDTFVNPIVSLDITTYGGTVRYDNLLFATSWDAVVPQPAGTSTWAGYEVDGNGNVDTGSWMGQLYVTHAPWIYSYSLGTYTYIPDEGISNDGSWTYILK